MGIQVCWDNPEQTILRYDFEGQWTWEEFRAAATEAFAMTVSVPHVVDTITYFHKGTLLPANALNQFRQAMLGAPPNRGINAIVGGTTLVRTTVYLFMKIYGILAQRLLLCGSLEQARSILERRQRAAAG
jgi:hypothetical protein